MIENPIERMQVYSTPDEGGVSINSVAILSDFICVAKMSGKTLAEATEFLKETWPTVTVEFFPNETKQ